VRLYRRATQSAWWTNADATVRARRALHLLTDEPAADARTRTLLAQALQASGQGEVAAPELTLAQGEIQCIGPPQPWPALKLRATRGLYALRAEDREQAKQNLPHWQAARLSCNPVRASTAAPLPKLESGLCLGLPSALSALGPWE